LAPLEPRCARDVGRKADVPTGPQLLSRCPALPLRDPCVRSGWTPWQITPRFTS